MKFLLSMAIVTALFFSCDSPVTTTEESMAESAEMSTATTEVVTEPQSVDTTVTLVDTSWDLPIFLVKDSAILFSESCGREDDIDAYNLNSDSLISRIGSDSLIVIGNNGVYVIDSFSSLKCVFSECNFNQIGLRFAPSSAYGIVVPKTLIDGYKTTFMTWIPNSEKAKVVAQYDSSGVATDGQTNYYWSSDTNVIIETRCLGYWEDDEEYTSGCENEKFRVVFKSNGSWEFSEWYDLAYASSKQPVAFASSVEDIKIIWTKATHIGEAMPQMTVHSNATFRILKTGKYYHGAHAQPCD